MASVSSPSIGFIFIVGRPRTYVISGLDFGSRVYLRAMGVSALARRAAPGSRARMPGSLSSRRWPTAPPWRRAPATSDVPICTLSSLGSRRVREEFKRPSRPGSQPTSRTGQRTCGRACTGVHARPHMLRLDGRLALARGLLRPSSELSGAGSRGADQLVGRKVERDAAEPGQRGRGWDRERRSRSESPSDGKAGRRGATAVERRAGEQKEAPPGANFRAQRDSYL